jgi:hypothetical protein
MATYKVIFNETIAFMNTASFKSFIDIAVCHNKDIVNFHVKTINQAIDSNTKAYDCEYFKVYNNGEIVLKNQKLKSGEISNIRMFPVELTLIEDKNDVLVRFTNETGSKYYIKFDTFLNTFEFVKEN